MTTTGRPRHPMPAATPGRRPVNRWLLPVAALAVFFGTIIVAQASGHWVTSGRDTLVAGSAAGAGAAETAVAPPSSHPPGRSAALTSRAG